MPRHATRTSFKKGQPSAFKGRHHTEEAKQKDSEAHKGKHPSEETRLKLSSAHLKRPPKSDDTRRKLSIALKGREFSQEHRIALSKAMKARMANPNNNPMYKNQHTEATRSKMSLAKQGKYNGQMNPMYGKHRPKEFCQLLSRLQTERYQNPLERNKQSQRIEKLWTDPNYIAKVMKGRNKRPTKPEQILIDILNNYLLGEFYYNGDFSLGIVIAGLIPDFVNVNGKKEIIEIFGDYFHSDKVRSKWHASELGRIMAYNSLGYSCLVIWEHEIYEESENEITNKIRQFFRR